MLVVQVVDKLAPGRQVFRCFAFPALEDTAIHPGLVFLLAQDRIVRVSVLVSLDVFLDRD